ncbi:uncharacterized protein LOC143188358 [Calliopsis andreniformis]|uniref:uncharacterized protein LOC143188358 n=1 Tax=Calliopsis andreniformis TaxID=337506 RepID=UPI003FCDC3D9
MDTQQQCLEKQLRKRESEVSELRRNLAELRTKFSQLERAFEINLQSQGRREVEFNRMKQESEEVQKLNNATMQMRTELNSKLTNAMIERDHWKNAFYQQKEFIERNKIQSNNAMGLIKQECEDILKMTRETTEKQFQELIGLYNEAKDKVTRLEEEVETYQSSQQEHENRTFELANLLETLKRFDLDVGSVCQVVAEALKNLTERGNLFDESMKNLRHLAWTTKNEKDESELALLKKQNSVLKEVIKNLKRKFQTQQESRQDIPERENEQRDHATSNETKINSTILNNDSPNGSTVTKPSVVHFDHSSGTLTQENHKYNAKICEEEKDTTLNARTFLRGNENRKNEFDIESREIDRCGRVLCIETHSGGIFYEEYIFKLSIDREIKLKYPLSLNNDAAMIKMELVDDESEYEKPQFDRISMFFRNIYASVNVKQTGVPCGTQTTKIKMCNIAAQTTLTGINSFSRLNVGATVSKQIFRFLIYG